MTPRQIGLLVLLSALWGGVFLLVKYALMDFSAVEVAFFQALIGALGLFGIVIFQGGAARAKLGDILRRPAQALLLGALAIATPFMLIALGELTVPSGLAGVLVSTTPMFVALFAPWIDPAMEINRRQGAGLAVGLLGVVALGLLCTAVAFMLYYRLIDHIGEERASLSNYLTPAFALLYGVLLLSESLTIWAIIGLVLIISGAEITLRGAGDRSSRREVRTRYRAHPPFH